MDQVIPISWLNKILLTASLSCALLCLIIGQWIGFTSLPIYITLIWSLIVIIGSTWFSFLILRMTLKANSPLNLVPLNNLIRKRLEIELTINNCGLTSESVTNDNSRKTNHNFKPQINIESTKPLNIDIDKLSNEIGEKLIDSWYRSISDEKLFRNKSDEILKKLITNICMKLSTINELRLTHKIADVLLLHMKEYRQALRRVERKKSKDIEDAYRYLHPGSRSALTLEHTLHCLVSIVAREFLQWELMSSLPCKLLLSVLAKRFLTILQDISRPQWIFLKLIALLETIDNSPEEKDMKNGVVFQGLTTGINSVTAAAISRPLPKIIPDNVPIVEITPSNNTSTNNSNNRISLCLDGLSTIGHKGLWADLNNGQVDYDDDDDRASPVYEEPTDFATTIARLRNLLQQKSTATTPLHIEEKSYAVCDGSQFLNLAIPWTEFHTSADGSQQLLYCIQFEDVEQHGDDMFETTTATVRRQYNDFVQLHTSLEESPVYSGIMSEIRLPEGGRMEMETYLKTLCTRLAAESPVQLRHFLRPSSGAGKKADAVAPRLDRFLAKTVTGVFNTLKTVVPGFEIDQEEDITPLPTLMPLSDIPWRFVENIKSKSLVDELQMLVAERIDYFSIDTAYEAVESVVESSGDTELLSHWWEIINAPYDEELEELDGKLTMTCAGLDLICEILAGIKSNNTLRQEAVIRWTKLFFGNVTEPLIHEYISRAIRQLSELSVISSKIYDDSSEESIDVMKNKLIKLLSAKIPVDLKIIFGNDDIDKIIKFLLDSMLTRKVNLDLMLQMVDIFVSELLAACKLNHVNLIT
ncbi:hypothetical protein PV325_007497 [Microctonus aethiopoides]|uniref:PXA domain-containing protein n=1 Tax=Microctonus aethiopoides TaxID=144406 RepID=A0AA39F7A9_9HYME|nr:hypothetical protein PV325_007497 [Microctonus aethiopoides]KAK0164280.1 hypothetical protein PV328_002926 [Microctonus aethiopoides]